MLNDLLGLLGFRVIAIILLILMYPSLCLLALLRVLIRAFPKNLANSNQIP